MDHMQDDVIRKKYLRQIFTEVRTIRPDIEFFSAYGSYRVRVSSVIWPVGTITWLQQTTEIVFAGHVWLKRHHQTMHVADPGIVHQLIEAINATTASMRKFPIRNFVKRVDHTTRWGRPTTILRLYGRIGYDTLDRPDMPSIDLVGTGYHGVWVFKYDGVLWRRATRYEVNGNNGTNNDMPWGSACSKMIPIRYYGKYRS